MNKTTTPIADLAGCTTRADCVGCDVWQSTQSSALSKGNIDHGLQPVHTRHLEAGTRLYDEATAGNHAYTIRRGLLKLTKAMPNGDDRIVRLISRSDFIGLEILLNEPYRHTAIAITPIELCYLRLDVLQALDSHSPFFRRQLMARWQKSVDEAESMITELATGKAASRLAHFILKYFSDGLAEVWNSPARHDIAQTLGITTETASRLMAEFKRTGLISEVHGRITIRDTVALKLLADN